MQITIQTLTPLWTGGVETGECDRIHETGLLGSLRWWMEVLVRGMGGNACDPTEQKCSSKNGLCEVCKIFGAEGQKRRFRLEVVQDNTKPDKDVLSKIELQPYQYQYKDKQGQEKTGTRTPTWYFSKNEEDKPRSGTFTVQIQSLHPSFKPEVIGELIQFISDCSALGARPQMGFGVIKILDAVTNGESIIKNERIPTQSLYDWLVTIPKSKSANYKEMPSLQNIFLAQIQPKDTNSSFKEEDTFNLKYDLRQLFRTEGDAAQQQSQGNKPILKKEKESSEDKKKQEERLRHFIMGTVEDDRMAAKIKVSRSYNDNKLIRVWGWVPTEAEVYKNGWNREKIVDAIYQHLKAHYTLHGWREMNPERDKATPNESSAQSFLCSLLGLEESSHAKS